MSIEQSAELDLSRTERTRPKYELIRDYLRSELSSSRLLPGQALPSETSLVKDFNVARNTVRQAMSELQRDGLIYRVQGKGTFVSDATDTRLSGEKMNVFALVTPDAKTGYYPALLEGFGEASSRANHQVIVCQTDNNLGRQADTIIQLLDKKVAGVAIVPTTDPPTPAYQIRHVQAQNTPLVYCHRKVEGVPAPLLGIPFHEISRTAGKTLLRHGHRRVGFFANPSGGAARIYEEELRRTLRDGGGDVPEDFVLRGDTPSTDLNRLEEPITEKLRYMFDHPDPPTAFMASWDPLAELIFILLGRLGKRVPEDISLLGVGGKWRQGGMAAQLTSVIIDEAELGRQAARVLHEMSIGRRPIDDDEEIMMTVDMHVGRTLAEWRG